MYIYVCIYINEYIYIYNYIYIGLIRVVDPVHLRPLSFFLFLF